MLGAHQVLAGVLAAAREIAQLLALELRDMHEHPLPAACSRASLIASRLSVLMRSLPARAIMPDADLHVDSRGAGATR